MTTAQPPLLLLCKLETNCNFIMEQHSSENINSTIQDMEAGISGRIRGDGRVPVQGQGTEVATRIRLETPQISFSDFGTNRAHQAEEILQQSRASLTTNLVNRGQVPLRSSVQSNGYKRTWSEASRSSHVAGNSPGGHDVEDNRPRASEV
jgi:hypothetical protein